MRIEGISADPGSQHRSPLYDGLAAVYDRWLSGDATAEPCLEFYRGEMHGHRGRALELGCGTGRITSMLASSGVDIVGIDVSLPMLRRAACGWPNRSETRPRIACGEFGRLPFRSSSFSTVIMPMRTLGHILDLQGRRAVFAEVYRVLQLDGRFVLDHYNLDEAWAKEHNGVPQLMHAGPADDDRSSALLIWDRYDYDFEARTLHCTVRIEEVGPSPMRISASSVEFDFRWFSASEIADLASWANLAVESCWGDFQRGPFTEKAEDMIFVLRK